MPYLKERIRKERRKEGRKENRIELEMMWGVHPGNEDLDARSKVNLQLVVPLLPSQMPPVPVQLQRSQLLKMMSWPVSYTHLTLPTIYSV